MPNNNDMLTIPVSTRRANRRSACGIGSGKPSAPVEGCPKPMKGSPGLPGAFLLVSDEIENRNNSGASIGPAEWPVRRWAEEASAKAEQCRSPASLKRDLCHRQVDMKRRCGHSFRLMIGMRSPWHLSRCGHCSADQSECLAAGQAHHEPALPKQKGTDAHGDTTHPFPAPQFPRCVF